MTANELYDEAGPEVGPEAGPATEAEDFSLLDVAIILLRHFRLVSRATILAVILGLIFAIGSPNQYTSSARVIRETISEESSSLAGGLAALRGIGLSFGSSAAGLTTDTYPDILNSREVHLAIARTPFYIVSLDSSLSLVDYHAHYPGLYRRIGEALYKVTIGLPGTLKGLFQVRFDPATVPIDGIIAISQEDYQTLKWLNKHAQVGVNRSSGIMTISVTTDDPLLSVQLAQAFVEQLSKRVREIYTQKAMGNLDFMETLFVESLQELEAAERELARFLDSNRNPQTARLRTEMERLQRKVDFKTNMQVDLQTQLTQAEIELQRSRPVITLIEAPMRPIKPAGPNRKLIVILFTFLGFGIGAAAAFLKQRTQQASRAQKARMDLLATAYRNSGISRWMGWLRKRPS